MKNLLILTGAIFLGCVHNVWCMNTLPSMSNLSDFDYAKAVIVKPKRPTQDQIETIFKLLLAKDEVFKAERKKSFKNFKNFYDRQIYDSVNPYFNYIHTLVNKHLMHLVIDKKIEFEIDSKYINWISKRIANKILFADIKILVGEFLFKSIKQHKENFMYQDVINELQNLPIESRSYRLINNFHAITDEQYKNALIIDVAQNMIKNIQQHRTSANDLTIELQKQLHQQQLEAIASTKNSCEQAMHKRDEAWQKEREKQL